MACTHYTAYSEIIPKERNIQKGGVKNAKSDTNLALMRTSLSTTRPKSTYYEI